MKCFVRVFILLLLVFSKTVSAQTAAVATSHPLVTAAAEKILKSGGTAADAAVAAALVGAVVEPGYSGLGGGGICLYFEKSQNQTVSFDYLESLPFQEMESLINTIAESEEGGTSTLPKTGEIAVPGLVAGLDKIHGRFGKTPWNELFTEALKFSGEGFAVDAKYLAALELMPKEYREKKDFTTLFLAEVSSKNVLVKQEKLAATLEKIRSNGGKEFYSGTLAKSIAAELTKLGHPVAGNDLSYYEVRVTEPSTFYFKDVKIVLPGPPSEASAFLDHLLRNARVSKADTRLPEFAPFIEEQAIKFLAIRPHLKKIPPLKSGYATAIVVADKFGNIAVMLNTLHGMFGSGDVLGESGILMNAAGRQDSVLSVLKENDVNVDWTLKRRPVNILMPMLLFQAFDESAGIAIPGNFTAPMNALQILLKSYSEELSLEKAIKAPKFYSLPQESVNLHEKDFSTKLLKGKFTGPVKPSPYGIGDVQIVVVDKKGASALADPRGSGLARTVKIKK